MNTQTDLIPGTSPTDPPKKHAPRAVINRLVEEADRLERESVSLIIKMREDELNTAHWNMDTARSLRVAAKWLEN